MDQFVSIGPTWNIQMRPEVSHMILVAIPEDRDYFRKKRNSYKSVIQMMCIYDTLNFSHGLCVLGVLHFQVVPSQPPCQALFFLDCKCWCLSRFYSRSACLHTLGLSPGWFHPFPLIQFTIVGWWCLNQYLFYRSHS